MRYTERPGGYEMDSRQDEDAAPCAECGCWQDDAFLEPCPRGVVGDRGPICNDCAEQIRAEVERSAAE